MVSHFALLTLFALCLAIAFAVLQRDRPREQVKLAGLLFVGFVLGAWLLGWLLFPFPLGKS